MLNFLGGASAAFDMPWWDGLIRAQPCRGATRVTCAREPLIVPPVKNVFYERNFFVLEPASRPEVLETR
jgi:hypothetical protein